MRDVTGVVIDEVKSGGRPLVHVLAAGAPA